MSVDASELIDYMLAMVLRAPHLYALTIGYWCLVVAVIATRYWGKRRRMSEGLMCAVVALGVVAVILAFVDVAIRGPELIQLSLVAYFATPIGVGRYLIRLWDGDPMLGWRGIAVRELTYVSAFIAFVGLSAVAGDPWWFERPVVDRSDPIAMIERTNWLHLMATVFGIVAIIEAVSGGFGVVRQRLASRA